MSVYKTDPRLSHSTSESDCAHVVATVFGHKPYTRHHKTIAGEPSITHRDLANDQKITTDDCLFDCDEDY